MGDSFTMQLKPNEQPMTTPDLTNFKASRPAVVSAGFIVKCGPSALSLSVNEPFRVD